MGDINSIGGVVKILETPKQRIFNDGITSITQCRAQFPQTRQNCLVYLTFWGNLAYDVAAYYKINDYILVEGYLSVREKHSKISLIKVKKKIDITVVKIYPIFLSY